MLMLSHLLAGIGSATHFVDPIEYVHELVDRSQQELVALDKEYSADLPDFEVFVKTEARQHLHKAIGMAEAALKGIAMEAGQFMLQPTGILLQKHENEWKAFYKAQIVSP